MLRRVCWYTGTLYLLITLYTLAGVLFSAQPLSVRIIGTGGLIICLLPLVCQKLVRPILFCFAVTFPLYGSHPYSVHSFLLEYFIAALGISCIVHLKRDDANHAEDTFLPLLLFLYCLFSFASLLILPFDEFAWKAIHWQWFEFWNAVYFATPELPLYSVAAVNRLVLFSLFITVLAFQPGARRIYHALFIGLLIGAVWSSLVGVLEYYAFLDLTWFRPVVEGGGRLQSMFANPGWFAEYLSVTVPYILL